MPLFLLFINFIEGITDQSAAYRREKSPVLRSLRAKLWHKTNLGCERQINKRSKAQEGLPCKRDVGELRVRKNPSDESKEVQPRME